MEELFGDPFVLLIPDPDIGQQARMDILRRGVGRVSRHVRSNRFFRSCNLADCSSSVKKISQSVRLSIRTRHGPTSRGGWGNGNLFLPNCGSTVLFGTFGKKFCHASSVAGVGILQNQDAD